MLHNPASNKLTNASLHLMASKNWDNLVSLHLGKNALTDEGVVALMKVRFPALKSLWLSTPYLT
jgi:hypothetical protein